MKGLEVSEVSLSEVVSSDGSFRIDAEYFKKNYLAYVQKIYSKNGIKMGDVCHFMIGPFGSAYDTSNYVKKSGYRYIRGQDVKPFFLSESEPRFMTEQDFIRLQKYALKKDDLLVSVVGTLGNACIVHESELPAIFSCKSTAVRSDAVNAYYLLAYLNSKYGRELLLRKERGAIQKGLNLDDLKSLDLPQFSNSFYSRVEIVVKHAHAKLFESNNLYRAAEQNLLTELGFAGWSPTNDTVSVKSYSEFASAGRFDAEYFQSKYEVIDKRIRGYRGGVVAASDALVTGLVNENAETEERYVELADIGANGEITGFVSAAFGELPSRARQRMEAGQVIVSSIEGSLDKCALVTPEHGNALCSTGFHRFCSTKINAETMLLLFKSWPIQQLMKRGCSGTILCGILPDELTNVPLPLVDSKVQSDLAAKVQTSFALRAESKRLLDLAKRMVEMAIEQSEAAALDLLKE